MNTELRKKVAREIDDADEYILNAVLASLKQYNKSSSKYKLTDEQLQVVRERKPRYEKRIKQRLLVGRSEGKTQAQD